ncbi:DUF11 domain-containing protein [Candidatus Saccharibacteria bacterium]|nr:DUF11 domain-containing protein [Candidatus Saccharibacteria bacterium]
MNKMLKVSAVAVAAAAAASAIVAPESVSAWGDNSGSTGRQSYTKAQINSGALGNKIVFNSISDSVIGDEKNFVGARLDDGNTSNTKIWNANEINVEDGKTYVVRIYVHNNNPQGTKATATGVRTLFSVPATVGTSVEVNGFIMVGGSTDTKYTVPITKYWDNVVFKGASNFHLEYVKGSAKLENNKSAAGGKTISDNLVTNAAGVQIGYDTIDDGKIPGCYEYAQYVTIRVKAVFENTSNFLVEKKVRKAGTNDEWKEDIDANVGDKVEYQIHYKNLSGAEVKNVMVVDSLPTNMKYVAGTTMLYNATNPKGIARDDTITTTGVNIGGYANNGDAYVRFTAEVIDKTLACGQNQLINWGKVTADKKVVMDSANVNVKKTGGTCDSKPVTPTPTKDDPTPTAGTMPTTGPAAIVTGALGAGSIVTAAGYFIASRKTLR